MKIILIDELLKEECIKEQSFVNIEGKELKGYTIAKPLNYCKNHVSFIDRLLMAKKVLFGKAIAVQYFQDLTQQQKELYVSNIIRGQDAEQK